MKEADGRSVSISPKELRRHLFQRIKQAVSIRVDTWLQCSQHPQARGLA